MLIYQTQDSAKWDPAKKIRDTIVALAGMQKMYHRHLVLEEKCAKEAEEYLLQVQDSEFSLRVKIKSPTAYTSRYYPRAVLKSREELLAYAYRHSGKNSLEEISQIHLVSTLTVESYFHNFSTGDHLGYGKELGDDWYMVLGDGGGFYYIPVASNVGICSTSF